MLELRLLLIVPAVAFVTSYCGVLGLRWLAQKRCIIDVPNPRSLHTEPVPRGGGLAIVAVTVAGVLVAVFFCKLQPLWALVSYAAGAVLVAAVGWLDDLHSLPRGIRFLTHCLAAVTIIVVTGHWNVVTIAFLGNVHLGWFGVLVTLMWCVGLTNAYNFMDGIDGIAGGQAAVAGFGWSLLGWLCSEPAISLLGILAASSALAFLCHNWSPARIFMGDVGSGFLGYTFAFLAVLASQHKPQLAAAGILLLWPFVFDSIFTFLRRFRRGENVFSPHRSHLYQRLVLAGMSHAKTSSLYIALAAVGTLLATVWSLDRSWGNLGTVIILPSLCWSLWRYVIRREKLSPPTPDARNSATRLHTVAS
jgi:UDP-N-acetylmuramyl pentapeptide phosphotransferase/UDP-N-acetylglucosamine-1-phosphate transferase